MNNSIIKSSHTHNQKILLRATTNRELSSLVKLENANQISPWSMDMLQSSLKAGDQIWVLEKEKNSVKSIIGFIVFSNKVEECEILNLVIDITERQQGCGKWVLEQVLKYVQKHGATRAFLEVRASNKVALALYQSLGFKEISRRKDYYRSSTNQYEDAIVEIKELMNERNH